GARMVLDDLRMHRAGVLCAFRCRGLIFGFRFEISLRLGLEPVLAAGRAEPVVGPFMLDLVRRVRRHGHAADRVAQLAPCLPAASLCVPRVAAVVACAGGWRIHGSSSLDRKSTRLNSSHVKSSYAVVCLKKKNASERV